MLIGLTGGIGSGKSVISNELRKMGYAVYDSDKEAKRLILENEQVREKMIGMFGKDIYRDGMYQTKLVAQQVFADSSLLAQLNAIVHPAVKEDLLRWSHAQMNLSRRCRKAMTPLLSRAVPMFRVDRSRDFVLQGHS